MFDSPRIFLDSRTVFVFFRSHNIAKARLKEPIILTKQNISEIQECTFKHQIHILLSFSQHLLYQTF